MDSLQILIGYLLPVYITFLLELKSRHEFLRSRLEWRRQQLEGERQRAGEANGGHFGSGGPIQVSRVG